MIISNTSPLINFAMIDQLPLLHELFGQLTIPSAVERELAQKYQRYPDVLAKVQQSGIVDVLEVKQTQLRDVLLLDLDGGEADALILAIEHRATLIILDEVAGRSIAEAQQLLYTGSIGCLVEAKHRGLIAAIHPHMDAMRQQAGFWLRDSVYERVLRDVGE